MYIYNVCVYEHGTYASSMPVGSRYYDEVYGTQLVSNASALEQTQRW